MTIAYSYVRFSNDEQKNGDSLRRQRELSYKWAKLRGIEIDESLDINDLGKSAFHGKNLKDGGLGLFISAIDEGLVVAGAFLLVENLDRLSRQEPLKALNLLQSIVNKGVTVVTLSDGIEYTEKSLSSNITYLLISLTTMYRAHQESSVKSERIGAAWKKKKRFDAHTGKPITAMAPGWLHIVDNKFEIIEDRAAIVRMIFEYATRLGLGQRAIVTKLKDACIPTFGRKAIWSETSIRRILQSEAVIGIYQPKSINPDNPKLRENDGDYIDDYYPPIVPKDQFYFAQTLRAQHLIPRGPRGKALGTIFTGIAFCGKCTATMRRKGKSTNDVYDRLRCANNCGAASWKYEPLEMIVLYFLENDLLPHVASTKIDRKKLLERLSEAEATVTRLSNSSKRLMDAIEIDDGGLQVLISRLQNIENSKKEAENSVKIILDEIKSLEAVSFQQKVYEETSDNICEVLAGIEVDGKGVREELRYALKRSIDKIFLYDSEEIRTIKFEVGNEVRHIDIDKKTLLYTCRENTKFSISVLLLHPVTGLPGKVVP